MKKKKTKNVLPDQAQEFLNRWAKNATESEKVEMVSELTEIMEEAFVWGRISAAPKKVDKSMQFTFEQWMKTNTH